MSEDSTQSRSSVGDEPPARAKLPKIELPTFDGNPLNWAVFWKRFNSIIQRAPGLSDADKVTHLHSAIKGRDGIAIPEAETGSGDDYVVHTEMDFI